MQARTGKIRSGVVMFAPVVQAVDGVDVDEAFEKGDASIDAS